MHGGGRGTPQLAFRGCAGDHDNWGTLLGAPEQRACAKEKESFRDLVDLVQEQTTRVQDGKRRKRNTGGW